MSPRVSIAHVAALDGLRGVAVAGVLVFHSGYLTGGYLGVAPVSRGRRSAGARTQRAANFKAYSGRARVTKIRKKW